MNSLIELVKEKINAAYLKEDQAVTDGTFVATPVLTTGIRGNGRTRSRVTQVALDFFYENKIESINKANEIKKILEEAHYICTDPSFSYERNACMYRITLQVNCFEGGIENAD